MEKRFVLALGLLTLSLMGCHRYCPTEGTVRDRFTLRPLEAVKYQVLQRYEPDSGYSFTGRNGLLSVTVECSVDTNVVIRLTKPGYDTLLLKNTRDSVFYLTPRKHPVSSK